VIYVTGVLFSVFYILTALATIVYYRRRLFGRAWDTLVLGVLPLAAAAFLGWILVRYLQTQVSLAEKWTLVGIIGVGVALMFSARFILKSPFFQIPRESEPRAALSGGHRSTT